MDVSDLCWHWFRKLLLDELREIKPLVRADLLAEMHRQMKGLRSKFEDWGADHRVQYKGLQDDFKEELEKLRIMMGKDFVDFKLDMQRIYDDEMRTLRDQRGREDDRLW